MCQESQQQETTPLREVKPLLTSAKVLIDKAFNLLQLSQVGGLQEMEEVPHVGRLLPGHGGSGGGGGSRSLSRPEGGREGSRSSLSKRPALPGGVPGPPANTVSRHHCRPTNRTEVKPSASDRDTTVVI